MRMKHPLTLALVVCSACSPGTVSSRAPSPAEPLVMTDAGMLSGVADPARGVVEFRGIPYASAPVGQLRWASPTPPAPWSGVRAASRPGKNCMQDQVYSDVDPFAVGVSEDCLYLNVWTTGVDPAARRPVMVWFHGGGYIAGFGAEGRHDGARLAQKGAVVVTLNYRLGAFGFLSHAALASTSPQGTSGNYGILDQVAALQWVRRNISQFGGDSSRVTIFGESAGGSSVGSLIASPLAKGLFHGAILQSGNAIGSTRSRSAAEADGLRFATVLGVNGTDAGAAAQLRQIPADSVQHATRRPNGTGGFTSVYSPTLVADGWVLPRTVDSALALGAANIVPVIVGATSGEGDAAYATARAFARLVTARNAPAYLYLFSRVGDDSVNRKRGAYHSADITFTFGLPRPILESAGHTTYDAALAEAMTDYFVAFAATGNPNGAPRASPRAVWPVYETATDAYIELGPQVVARSALRRTVYDSLDKAGRDRGQVRPR